MFEQSNFFEDNIIDILERFFRFYGEMGRGKRIEAGRLCFKYGVFWRTRAAFVKLKQDIKTGILYAGVS